MNEYELAQEFEKQNITLAPIYKRVIAFLIDEVIVSFFIIFAFYETFQSMYKEDDVISLIKHLVPYIATVKIVYQAFFVWAYGASPGKMLTKIKIIHIYTIGKPTFIIACLRSVGRVFSEMLYYIGFFWALLNPKRETWQDIVAKTLVINA